MNGTTRKKENKMTNQIGKPKAPTLITPLFRVSFNHLWTPSKNDDGTEIYSVTCIFENDPQALKPMLDAVNQAIQDKWKGKKPAGCKMPFRKGTAEEYDLDKYPEYEGKVIAALRSYSRPVGVVDAQRQPIINKEDFYSGCYAVASYSVYCYDKPTSKGVSFGLYNVMKIKDGEPLISRHVAEADFQEIDLSKYGVTNEEMFAGQSGGVDDGMFG
jgi:hypothetical protein